MGIFVSMNGLDLSFMQDKKPKADEPLLLDAVLRQPEFSDEMFADFPSCLRSEGKKAKDNK